MVCLGFPLKKRNVSHCLVVVVVGSNHLCCKCLHIRVSVLPHGRPDLTTVDEPHVLVEVRLSDVLTDGGEQVDECLQQQQVAG